MAVNRKVRTGNKILVTVGGTTVGLGQSVDLHEDYQQEALYGCGDIHPQDYAPNIAQMTVTISEMVLLNGSLRSQNKTPTSPDDVLKGRSFDILVIDKDGGLVRKYRDCFYTSGDVQIRKHGIVIANATYKAMDVSGSGA